MDIFVNTMKVTQVHTSAFLVTQKVQYSNVVIYAIVEVVKLIASTNLVTVAYTSVISDMLLATYPVIDLHKSMISFWY